MFEEITMGKRQMNDASYPDVLRQTKYWRTQMKDVLAVGQLDPEHLINILNYLPRTASKLRKTMIAGRQEQLDSFLCDRCRRQRLTRDIERLNCLSDYELLIHFPLVRVLIWQFISCRLYHYEVPTIVKHWAKLMAEIIKDRRSRCF